MVKGKHIAVAIAMVILGTLLVSYLFPSEEKKVRRQFRQLAECVSKKPVENAITMAQKTRNLGALFDESCTLTLPSDFTSGTYTPEDIMAYAVRGRAFFIDLSLTFYDLSVTFPEKGVAKVTVTANLRGTSTGGDQVDDTREIQCQLRKKEKRWLFSEVGVVEVLQK